MKKLFAFIVLMASALALISFSGDDVNTKSGKISRLLYNPNKQKKRYLNNGFGWIDPKGEHSHEYWCRKIYGDAYMKKFFAGNKYTLRQSASNVMIFNGSTVNIAPSGTASPVPGDTLVFPVGTWNGIRFGGGFNGTEGLEIVFTNPSTGPQVVLGSDATGGGTQPVKILMQHWKMMGNANPSITYGIKMRGGTTSANTCLSLYEAGSNASDFELAYLEFGGADGLVSKGMHLAPNTGNDMYNIYIHHNYAHNIGYPTANPNDFSEVFYGGYSLAVSEGNPPTDYPQFYGVRVSNNIIDTCAGDGVQWKMAHNLEIDSNYINYYGYNMKPGQSYGVQIGDGNADSHVHHNFFYNGQAGVYFNKGYGNHRFDHNTIRDVRLFSGTHEDGALLYINGYRFDGTFAQLTLQVDSNKFQNSTAFTALIEINSGSIQTGNTYFRNCFTGDLAGEPIMFGKKSSDDTTNMSACYDTSGTPPPVGPTTPKKPRFKRWNLRYAYYSPAPQRMYANKPKNYYEEDYTEYSA